MGRMLHVSSDILKGGQSNQTMGRMLHVSSDIVKGGHQVQHYIKLKKNYL